MFNQDDLDALTNATGMSEVEVMANEQIGAEYIAQQRMYHLMGQQGALPPWMLVVMLRMLGFEPPQRAAPPKGMEVRWDVVRKGTRVIVAPDDKNPQKQLYGTYQYSPELGLVAVLLDGAVGGWVDEFPMRQVSLAPVGTPKFVAPIEPLVDSLRPAPEPLPQPSVNGELHDDELEDEEIPTGEEEDELPPDEPEAVLTPGSVDRSDPEGRVHVPSMEKDWSEIDPGTPVVYQDGDDLLDAEFIEDGPADGHVSIAINGQTKVVPESLVLA